MVLTLFGDSHKLGFSVAQQRLGELRSFVILFENTETHKKRQSLAKHSLFNFIEIIHKFCLRALSQQLLQFLNTFLLGVLNKDNAPCKT